MKTVYLCGGINGLSDSECRDWRERARELLVPLGTLDPLRRDYRGVEDESAEEIVSGDLRDIANCDVVLVNALRPSWGTAMEVVYAAMLQKYVVAVTGEKVSPWLRFHTNSLHPQLEEACAHILGAVAE